MAAAAAVLLLVSGGTLWWAFQRPVLDLDTVLGDVQQRHAGPDTVAAWYRTNYRIHAIPPSDFDYTWLASCSVGLVQGQRVPELVFIRGSLHCRVWILTTRQFDLTLGRVSSGGYTVELRQDPNLPLVAYLVAFQGDSLEPFLLRLDHRLDAA